MLRGVIDGYRQDGVPAALVDAEKRRAIAQAEFKANSIQPISVFSGARPLPLKGLNSPDDILSAYPQGYRRRRQPRAAHLRRSAARDRRHRRAEECRRRGAAAAPAPVGNENKPTLLHHDPLPDGRRQRSPTSPCPLRRSIRSTRRFPTAFASSSCRSRSRARSS